MRDACQEKSIGGCNATQTLPRRLQGHPPHAGPDADQDPTLSLDKSRHADTSPELQGLIDGMLRKDPASRLMWHQVTSHAFWLQPLPCCPIPPQPELEALVAQQAQQVRGL